MTFTQFLARPETTKKLDAWLEQDRAAHGGTRTHACDGCGKPAQHAITGPFSGLRAFVCYACDERGRWTFVRPEAR